MVKRRVLLLSAAALAAGKNLIACGGGGAAAASDTGNPPPPDAWVVAPRLYAGHPEIVFDLAPTLPASVTPGGTFAVDPSGAPLPSGVALSAAGVLSLTDAASAGMTQGVVFVYTEQD
jgi:hypothetical protein